MKISTVPFYEEHIEGVEGLPNWSYQSSSYSIGCQEASNRNPSHLRGHLVHLLTLKGNDYLLEPKHPRLWHYVAALHTLTTTDGVHNKGT